MKQNTSEENLLNASIHSFMLKNDLLYICPHRFLIIKKLITSTRIKSHLLLGTNVSYNACTTTNRPPRLQYQKASLSYYTAHDKGISSCQNRQGSKYVRSKSIEINFEKPRPLVV